MRFHLRINTLSHLATKNFGKEMLNKVNLLNGANATKVAQ
jgi:hypothetical protein